MRIFICLLVRCLQWPCEGKLSADVASVAYSQLLLTLSPLLTPLLPGKRPVQPSELAVPYWSIGLNRKLLPASSPSLKPEYTYHVDDSCELYSSALEYQDLLLLLAETYLASADDFAKVASPHARVNILGAVVLNIASMYPDEGAMVTLASTICSIIHAELFLVTVMTLLKVDFPTGQAVNSSNGAKPLSGAGHVIDDFLELSAGHPVLSPLSTQLAAVQMLYLELVELLGVQSRNERVLGQCLDLIALFKGAAEGNDAALQEVAYKHVSPNVRAQWVKHALQYRQCHLPYGGDLRRKVARVESTLKGALDLMTTKPTPVQAQPAPFSPARRPSLIELLASDAENSNGRSRLTYDQLASRTRCNCFLWRPTHRGVDIEGRLHLVFPHPTDLHEPKHGQGSGEEGMYRLCSAAFTSSVSKEYGHEKVTFEHIEKGLEDMVALSRGHNYGPIVNHTTLLADLSPATSSFVGLASDINAIIDDLFIGYCSGLRSTSSAAIVQQCEVLGGAKSTHLFKSVHCGFIPSLSAHTDPDWRVLSGSSDVLTVLGLLEMNATDGAMLFRVRVINGADFKIPSFLLSIEVRSQVRSRARTKAGEADRRGLSILSPIRTEASRSYEHGQATRDTVLYSCRVTNGEDYMLPNSLVEREFILGHRAFGPLDIAVKVSYPDVQLADRRLLYPAVVTAASRHSEHAKDRESGVEIKADASNTVKSAILTVECDPYHVSIAHQLQAYGGLGLNSQLQYREGGVSVYGLPASVFLSQQLRLRHGVKHKQPVILRREMVDLCHSLYQFQLVTRPLSMDAASSWFQVLTRLLDQAVADGLALSQRSVSHPLLRLCAGRVDLSGCVVDASLSDLSQVGERGLHSSSGSTGHNYGGRVSTHMLAAWSLQTTRDIEVLITLNCSYLAPSTSAAPSPVKPMAPPNANLIASSPMSPLSPATPAPVPAIAPLPSKLESTVTVKEAWVEIRCLDGATLGVIKADIACVIEALTGSFVKVEYV